LYQKGDGNYDDALKYFQRAFETLKKFTPLSSDSTDQNENVGKDGNDEQYKLLLATTTGSISNVYKMQHKYESAVDFSRQALAILISAVGEQHPDVANTYNTLGEIYASHGNVVESLHMYEKAKDIFTKTFGRDHPHTALCHFNIGLMLRKDPDRIPEATEAFQKARNRWAKSLGSDNFHVLEAEKQLTELKDE
jgi:tetratricopeptide (TPR) repeat protein